MFLRLKRPVLQITDYGYYIIDEHTDLLCWLITKNEDQLLVPE
jgi:hypothetical protein